MVNLSKSYILDYLPLILCEGHINILVLCMCITISFTFMGLRCYFITYKNMVVFTKIRYKIFRMKG